MLIPTLVVLLQVLGHLQVFPEDRHLLLGERPHLRVVAVLGFLLEVVDVLFVVLDHLVNVLAVELVALEPAEPLVVLR